MIMNKPGIDIALIDSGINAAHSHVGNVAGGVSLALDPKGNLIIGDDFSDEIGHGTAIAGVISAGAPSARLHAVKIFRTELRAATPLLMAALEWAVEKNMKIVHLSLGTEREEDRNALSVVCGIAHEKDIVVVASARSFDDEVFPASLDSVIGVCWDKECDEDSLIYYSDAPIEFGAYGFPRPLPGMPKEANFRGHSFAAAHITARAAQLLEKNPSGGVAWVREELAQRARMKWNV
jgi:subtilisin family serine protease